MTIGIVILARFSSKRLPGKALMTIDEKPVLMYIIERLLTVVSKEQVVLATSDHSSDDPIVNFGHLNDIPTYRGDLENVAERFYHAAAERRWDFAVRINGDNIFVDTAVLRQMIDLAMTNKYDFLSNVKDRTFPKGMSVEIVRMHYYKNHLFNITKSEYAREHVMVSLYDAVDGRKYFFMNTVLPEAGGIQMALDTHEDFDRTKQILSKFEKPHWQYNLTDIFHIYKKLKL